MGEPRRFLFAMWDGGGNVPPVLGLARRLVERGHAVGVLGDPTLEAEARLAGVDHLPWRTAPHRKTRRPEDDVVKDYDIGNPFSMIKTYIGSFIGKPAPAWAADTLAALESWHADVLVCDASIPAAMIAAEKLGVPSVGLVPNIWMLPTPGIPPLGPGLAPARGPLGRLRDWILRGISHWAFSGATPYINATRASYGLPPVATVYEQMLAVEEVLVLTSPRFDFTSRAMPGNVRYAGPVLDDPAWCAAWSSPWAADDARPLVLVGLSSTFQRQADTLRRIVEALSTLPVRALVTLGQTIAVDEVRGTENVVVVPSAPHSQILRDASVLVTHCGHGTTMRALGAGVPLVCVPMGRDQNDTAARVVHHGAGVRLSPKAAPHAIRAAVERALTDPALRAGARRMQQALMTRDGCVDPIESLERIATKRGAADARPPAAAEATSGPRPRRAPSHVPPERR